MENAMRSNTGATGTISYCAPEVLKRGQFLQVVDNFGIVVLMQ